MINYLYRPEVAARNSDYLSYANGNLASQKLVDPNSVAPEFREAAIKRRAEQIKLFECSKKADAAKVLRRDRVTFINECLDK